MPFITKDGKTFFVKGDKKLTSKQIQDEKDAKGGSGEAMARIFSHNMEKIKKMTPKERQDHIRRTVHRNESLEDQIENIDSQIKARKENAKKLNLPVGIDDLENERREILKDLRSQ